MSHERSCQCGPCREQEVQILRRLAELLDLFKNDQEPGLQRIYRQLAEWQLWKEGKR